MASASSCAASAIRYGRMPEAEKKKLVAGLLAGEKSQLNPGSSDLKTLAKNVNSAYLKNLNMTKKKARSILTGKTSCTPVLSTPHSRSLLMELLFRVSVRVVACKDPLHKKKTAFLFLFKTLTPTDLLMFTICQSETSVGASEMTKLRQSPLKIP